MDWNLSRERLGAELIGSREDVVARWRLLLRDEGAPAWALDRCAAELVLHAGASLADATPPSMPWNRCGGLLRIDARGQGRELALELTVLWRCMAAAVARLSLSIDEERRAVEILGQQMEAALRGGSAELRAALLDEVPDDAALRFGGVRAICWTPLDDQTPGQRAA